LEKFTPITENFTSTATSDLRLADIHGSSTSHSTRVTALGSGMSIDLSRHKCPAVASTAAWIPAFAGMTTREPIAGAPEFSSCLLWPGQAMCDTG
jgi:hypothetical protein